MSSTTNYLHISNSIYWIKAENLALERGHLPVFGWLGSAVDVTGVVIWLDWTDVASSSG